SHKCYYVFSPNSTTSEESEIECIGDRCMTACQYAYNHGDNFKSLFKNCANESVCGTKGSLAVENIIFRFFVLCCNGSLCNIGKYELPVEDPTPNGKKCPSAYCTGNLEECKSDKEMNCTGSMDRCFEVRTEGKYPGEPTKNYSIKGCANSDGCKYNFDTALGVAQHKKLLIC
ncbi:urokinase plasminogen activator surface receptor-like, partial [Anomaloglossus baeobatrachus]|uniref:urokinase plasminogen activator surface receptor-like n=1 Tax=Anomaloglossus baeobatrachus TaxID=238106 RepID=UPI003F50B064